MTRAHKASTGLTSLLGFIFFFSGFAALIYQVVWQRLLTVHYGVGAVSITIIISIYMFGLGAGSLLGGFLAERVKNRITLYFVVELLIGCFGLVSLPFLHFLGRHTAGSNYMISFLYMSLFLCLPTILMGITLPLLTKIYSPLIGDFLGSVSFLYFINTLGAALGAVCASYGLISFFGLDTSLYAACVINLLLAGLIFIARYMPAAPRREEHAATGASMAGALGRLAYPVVLVTGFLAIGYEIVWFRVVGVLVKASPYAFSTVLSIYLLGIALGSIGVSRYLRRREGIDRKGLFFFLQFLIGMYVIISVAAYYYLTKYTPLGIFSLFSFSEDLHPRLVIPAIGSIKPLLYDIYTLTDVFLWPALFVFVPTILMGASFPLISFLALTEEDKEGSTVGTVYFFNIVGNVLGGIVTGFLILPFIGTETTLLLFALVNISLLLFASGFANKVRRTAATAALAAAAILFFPRGGQLYRAMHFAPAVVGEGYNIYFEEGIDGIVLTYQNGEVVKNYISGLGHGGRPGYWFYYQAIEAASYAPKTGNVLIIGYGAGTITEAILNMDDAEKVTVVELSDTLMNNLTKMELFEDMVSDPRLRLVIDDGRRFLLRTDEKFDLILMDPLRTTTAYSNNIYSREFFELAEEHLKPGGVFLVYTEELRVMPKTVLSVFDYVRWYYPFCVASNEPLKRNDRKRSEHLGHYTPRERALILQEEEYLGDESTIEKMTKGYPVNRDRKPVCEYYLGLKVKEKLDPGLSPSKR
ncbi:MAG: fused MFS/spermidine synthase [Candidatus Tritonobacter lacicola]|nr:fused MFS/spermidine synthase [Candidatus Tritonobacter lacicola]